MSQENKAIVARFYEQVVNAGNLALAEELMAPDYIEHGRPEASGIDGFTRFVKGLAVSFPDLHLTLDELIAEGDRVVARVTVAATHQGTFMGIPATGKRVVFSGVDIFHVAGGRIQGRWNQRDIFGLVQQLRGDTIA